MSQYDSLRATATRLINQFGRSITVQRNSEPVAANQAKPWEVVAPNRAAPQTVVVNGVVVPIMHKRIDGTAVLKTDKTCYVSAADVETAFDMPLRPLDTIVDSRDARTYVVQDVEDISPGDQLVLFVLQLRGNG